MSVREILGYLGGNICSKSSEIENPNCMKVAN